MHGNVGTSRHIQRALPEFGEVIERILQALGREIARAKVPDGDFLPHPHRQTLRVAARIEGAKVTHHDYLAVLLGIVHE